jgi:integrase
MAKGNAKNLTALGVKKMKQPSEGRTETWDAKVSGLFIRVTKTGKKSWGLDFRFSGKRERLMLGSYPVVGLDDARGAGMAALKAVRDGVNPAADKRAAKDGRVSANTVRGVTSTFVERYAKRRNRSWRETERIFDKYVVPVWKDRQLADIKRADLISLLDDVEQNNGSVMSDAVLAQIRILFNWAIDRDIVDATPAARVKRRTSPKDRARRRWLKPEEIKAVWSGAEAMDYPFGPFVKMLLLTGQRRSEVAFMRWEEIAGDTWTIPGAKTKNKQEHEVPLSQGVMQLLGDIPNVGDYLFMSGRSRVGDPISGFSKAKTNLDKWLVADGQILEPWSYHDLRRTVRTHLSRINVAPGVAERVLNHTPQGVEAIYDRHHYLEEKRQALEAWSKAVGAMLDGDDGTVVDIASRRP